MPQKRIDPDIDHAHNGAQKFRIGGELHPGQIVQFVGNDGPMPIGAPASCDDMTSCIGRLVVCKNYHDPGLHHEHGIGLEWMLVRNVDTREAKRRYAPLYLDSDGFWTPEPPPSGWRRIVGKVLEIGENGSVMLAPNAPHVEPPLPGQGA